MISAFLGYAVVAYIGLLVWMVKSQPEPQTACVILKDLTL